MMIVLSFNTHTHTGCDGLGTSKQTFIQSFNTHTHTGCDYNKKKNQQKKYLVSIHTPIQGVTQ